MPRVYVKAETNRIISITGLSHNEAEQIAQAHWRRMLESDSEDSAVFSEGDILSAVSDSEVEEIEERSEYDIFMTNEVQRIKETQIGISHLRALQIAAWKWNKKLEEAGIEPNEDVDTPRAVSSGHT
ncbi:hypothetical protein HK096_004904, partial [Nowakowskiella sp. JEL0078]